MKYVSEKKSKLSGMQMNTPKKSDQNVVSTADRLPRRVFGSHNLKYQ